jgi:hypothetical protein
MILAIKAMLVNCDAHIPGKFRAATSEKILAQFLPTFKQKRSKIRSNYGV